MKLSDIIRADKTNVDLGKWQSGHIPRNAFPLSKLKSKRYKYGSEYRWRVVRFVANNLGCRILILLNEGKGIYRARLGVEMDSDLVVLCDHEFHSGEPGWHCHLCGDDIEAIEPGAARTHTVRWPKRPELCSLRTFKVSETSALSEAAARFRFKAQGSLL